MLAPSSQSDLLRLLQQKLLAWEADCRPGAATFSTGCEAMDRILPGNGLHRAAIVEYVAKAGSGATVLSLIAAREACRDGGAFVVVDRSRRFNPPAAANVGIDLGNTIFVRPRTRKDELWALIQALRCQGVGAVLAWPEKLDSREFRALQLASEAGGGVGIFLRPTSVRGLPSWSKVQMLVEALPSLSALRRLRTEVLRCRNGQAGQSIEVEVDDETGSVRESCAVSLPSSMVSSTREAGPAGA